MSGVGRALRGDGEPAIKVGAWLGIATAVIGVLVAYAVLDEAEAVAWTAIVASLAPVISGFITRGKVMPVPTGPDDYADDF